MLTCHPGSPHDTVCLSIARATSLDWEDYCKHSSSSDTNLEAPTLPLSTEVNVKALNHLTVGRIDRVKKIAWRQ